MRRWKCTSCGHQWMEPRLPEPSPFRSCPSCFSGPCKTVTDEEFYSARIATLEAENSRLHKFKNQAAHILHSLTAGVIRVMEEQLDQSRKVAAQMQKEIEDFTETGGE